MIIKGNDIIIKTGIDSNTQGGGTVLGMMKNCDIDIKCDTIETCPSANGRYKTFIPGRIEWSLSSNHLIETMYSFLIKAGTGVVLQIRNRNNTRDALYGNAIITECAISASRGNLAVGSFKFRGSGILRGFMQ